MSRAIIYTDWFVADVRLQWEWFAREANEALAIRFGDGVDAALEILASSPFLGPRCRFPNAELHDLHYFLLGRPFHRQLIFYKVFDDEIVAFRTISGWRDFPQRLLDAPGAA